MAVRSMTGFARASAQSGDAVLSWELKSVNGKALEIRLRLPPGMEALDQPARAAIQKRLTRGNVQAALTVARGAGTQGAVAINEPLLDDLARRARRLEEEFGCAPARADGLLALRGVIEQAEGEDAASLAVPALACLEEAADALDAARQAEGEALRGVLLRHVDRIAELTARAEADPSRDTARIRERLAGQVALLLEASPALDESRLHAEAAFLATKADIREEIDRLKAHVDAARALLAGGGVIGRRLDFLSQEFNREANTLCSKSNAAAVTTIGLDLKVAIDQFREQVQNLE